MSVFNELWEHAQKTCGWRAEQLSVNYRSIKPLVDLANHTFEHIFVASGKDDVLLQRIQTQLQKMTANREKTSDEPYVELAIFRPKNAQSKWQRLRVEADWIAQRILELTKNGVRQNEIAVLLRELVNASVYEDALRRNGIPYLIIAGYGFFGTMEARDLLTFCKSSPNPMMKLRGWLGSSRQ
ncbi:MAG: hypothetical protein N2381_03240 [Armatimonadetes bacterium]|nr:hypothetical protein [Armatimonadota bacterium]